MASMSTKQLLALQVRVIGGLILRETRATFGTSVVGYVWAIVTPAASIGILVFIFSLVGRQTPFGSSFALFFSTGMLTLQFFNELSNKLMTVFNANKALLTYPVIKDVDTLIARACLICLTYLTIMGIFYGSLYALDLMPPPAAPEQLVLAYLACAFLGFGFGAFNAVLMSLWETWAQIEKVLTRPLFFISGVFYVPGQLPPEAIAILQWNPVLHLIEWFRIGFYPNYTLPILDKTFPITVGVIFLVIALSGERLFRKHRSLV